MNEWYIDMLLQFDGMNQLKSLHPIQPHVVGKNGVSIYIKFPRGNEGNLLFSLFY